MDKPAVCIATNRPESFFEWAKAWADEFSRESVAIFVMHDSEDKAVTKTLGAKCLDAGLNNSRVYDHRAVAKELGGNAWIIPKKTSACKSYAIYKAWKHGFDPIMVLDDDCYPGKQDWIKGHVNNMLNPVHNHTFLTCKAPYPRGYPHLPDSPVMLSHGLWTEIADTYAYPFLNRSPGTPGEMRNQEIAVGCLFPMSGMNVAFRREIAPLMYFGLQGKAWGVDRFDDIWAGFIAKKVLDHCGYAVWSGKPHIRHIKASDMFANAKKEAPGLKLNVELYEWVMSRPPLSGLNGPKGVLEFLARAMVTTSQLNGDYWANYGKAILAWLELFKPEEAFGI